MLITNATNNFHFWVRYTGTVASILAMALPATGTFSARLITHGPVITGMNRNTRQPAVSTTDMSIIVSYRILRLGVAVLSNPTTRIPKEAISSIVRSPITRSMITVAIASGRRPG